MRIPSSMRMLLSLSALVGAAFLLQAQDPAQERPESPPHPRNPRAFNPRPLMPAAEAWPDILRPEQRERLRDAYASQRERLLDLDQRTRELQRESVRLALAGRGNEDKIERLAQEIGELETQRAVIRAKALAEVGETLTPEQRERLPDRIAQFAENQGRPGPPLGYAGRGYRMDRPAPPERHFAPRVPERRESLEPRPGVRDRGPAERSRDEWRRPESRQPRELRSPEARERRREAPERERELRQPEERDADARHAEKRRESGREREDRSEERGR